MRGKIGILFAAAMLAAGAAGGKALTYSAHSRAVYLESGDGEKSLYEHQWALKNEGQIKLVERAGGNVLMSGSWVDSNIGSTEDIIQITSGVPGLDIGVEPAWEVYAQSSVRRPVVIALIDTGVDVGHPDLYPGIWRNPGEIPGDGIDNDGNGYIDDIYGWNFCDNNNILYTGIEDDHGTHAAGTMIGCWDGKGITGIADSTYVKVMVLKALGADGKGDSKDVIAAVQYAKANGAQICNLSFGANTYDPQLDKVIRDSGMLFVISSGNGDESGAGIDIDKVPMYPASFSDNNIISVANMVFDGSLHPSSNYGMWSVDIAAPGSYILSTASNHGYGYMTGTSMAAPMVSGAAALIASCRDDLSVTEIQEALVSSARKIEGLEGKVSTGGMLDVYGAITYQKRRE